MAQKQKTPLIIDEQLYNDEELVWWGQPIPSFTFRRTNWVTLLPNLFIIGFAIFFIIFSQELLADMRSPSTFGSFGSSRNNGLFETVFPLFFLFVPLMMIAGSAWSVSAPFREWYKATKTYYALTNKRALIIVDAFSTSTNSYYDEQMQHLNVTQYGNGIGDIVFTTRTETQTYYRRRRQRTRTVQVSEGFFAVPDARTVEDFIAQIFFSEADS